MLIVEADMWRGAATILGVSIIVLVLSQLPFVMIFRFDSEEEYLWLLRMDVKIGALFALGVFLIGIPPVGCNTKRWRAVWLLIVFLTWLCISGGLAWAHYESFRFRSSY